MEITLESIEKAYSNIQPQILKTDLSYSRSCTEWVGVDTYLKFENQQKTGSFKIRGAVNKLKSIVDAGISKNVIAVSAGNHAQGVAQAATAVGLKSTIVMPVNTSLVKVEATKGYGAEVILHGNDFEESHEHAKKVQKENDLIFIHPYEDPDIVAGQGTIGLEVLDQLEDVDSVIVAIGGGGLISGIATAIKTKKPSCKVYGVVAEGYSIMKERFHSELPTEASVSGTLADGIAVKKSSEALFNSVIKKHVDDIIVLGDDEIAEAQLFLLERAKTVVEGAGAIALAAAAHRPKHWDLGKKTCPILCGGNIDLHLVSQVIQRGLVSFGRVGHLSIVSTDQPGLLSLLTKVIAEEGANILEVHHDRLGKGLKMKEAEIKFALETKNSAQLNSIVDKIKSLNIRVTKVEG